MKKTLIIYCHPYEGSLNHAILEAVTSSLTKIKREYNVIDLIEDSFNPVYSKEELRLFSHGDTTDPLVTKYQELIKNSNQIIFIFPIWWAGTPAIVKGFIDKVMKYNFAYHYGEEGLIGDLTYIKQVVAITTSSSSKEVLAQYLGNEIQRVFLDVIWKQLGVANNLWFHTDVSLPREELTKFLGEIKHNIENDII